MTYDSSPYKIKFRPKILKALMLACDIRQTDLMEVTNYKRPTINLVVNRGDYLPADSKFRVKVETHIKGMPCCIAWLRQRDFKIADIWKSDKGDDLRKAQPLGHGVRVSKAMQIKPMVLGDPEAGEFTVEEEMLSLKARKLFKVFTPPFGGNFDVVKDAFLSEDHRFIRLAMKETADTAGMIAVIGEVGSGKTAMFKMFLYDLKQEGNIRLIFPRIINKEKLTDGSICDAIILDLAGKDAKCPTKNEQKARRVEDLMVKHARSGIKLVMVIEEAQDLAACPKVLKLFKRFNEIECDGAKVLAIILIGQPELGDLLNEDIHYEMREVIRRMQVAEIAGLNGSIKAYLAHKFERVGLKLESVMTETAIEALGKRLTIKDQGREVSIAYPLTVNNYVIKAMNWAAVHGETKVTDAVVNAIQ